MQKNVAKVLVFLANVPEASSRAIERGSDLRQPEVSVAVRYMVDQGWLSCRDSSEDNKKRPLKVYTLAKPVDDIMDSIEKKLRRETTKKLAMVRKLQDYVK